MTDAAPRRWSGALVVTGAVLTVLGGAVVVLYFFQPWRSCEYEDTSVGCAMLPGDAAAMQVAGSVVLIGVIVLAAGVLRRPTERRRRRRA